MQIIILLQLATPTHTLVVFPSVLSLVKAIPPMPRKHRPFPLAENVTALFGHDPQKSAMKAANHAGDEARESADLEEAERQYERSLEINPEQPWIWLQYAHILRRRGKISDSRIAYSKARAAYLNILADICHSEGYLYLAENNKAEAKNRFLSALLLERRYRPDPTPLTEGEEPLLTPMEALQQKIELTTNQIGIELQDKQVSGSRFRDEDPIAYLRSLQQTELVELEEIERSGENREVLRTNLQEMFPVWSIICIYLGFGLMIFSMILPIIWNPIAAFAFLALGLSGYYLGSARGERDYEELQKYRRAFAGSVRGARDYERSQKYREAFK